MVAVSRGEAGKHDPPPLHPPCLPCLTFPPSLSPARCATLAATLGKVIGLISNRAGIWENIKCKKRI
ncbi:hypothetical protein E2C01_094593 [Portunus trituberculatus]|uniref:Uncharacterized protein n=1 Tax=Portunus trituberculatus TaxID=210409 RepID=A0A5B7JXL8_PORTR|nr:hypothetical protein [Portunus trituberculatus]